MFTGIVEGMAKVESVSRSKKGADIAMRVKLGSKLAKGLRVGDSVCVSGACLTVARLSKKGEAEFEMVAETIRRTNLSAVKPGDMVNIERSLKVGDRLEGHFVLGHVDGTGVIKDIIKLPSETKLWIRLDDALLKSVVPKWTASASPW
jgi:riboflavin synthase